MFFRKMKRHSSFCFERFVTVDLRAFVFLLLAAVVVVVIFLRILLRILRIKVRLGPIELNRLIRLPVHTHICL